MVIPTTNNHISFIVVISFINASYQHALETEHTWLSADNWTGGDLNSSDHMEQYRFSQIVFQIYIK